MNNEDKNLKDAQYRKSLSIAFFNATNAAIDLVTKSSIASNAIFDQATLMSQIQYWRDWFLAQHMEYYSNKISNVGALYNSSETIKKLEATKSRDELEKAWIALSEDERRDGDIIAKVSELKKVYETS